MIDLGTNSEAATLGLAKALDRARKLEAEADRVFADLHQAQQRMVEVGVTVDVELTPGMAAAFSLWKQDRAASEGAAIGRDEVIAWPARMEGVG